MENLSLTSSLSYDVTLISNLFIDEYMAASNGEYVKIYLYLLRCVTNNVSCSIHSMAEKLNDTEGDIIRGLNYWKQQGLLSLSFDSDNIPTRIQLLPIKSRDSAREDYSLSKSPADLTLNPSVSSPIPIQAPVTSPGRHEYSLDQMREFQKREDVQMVIEGAQGYLKRQLSPTDINSLLYIYNDLNFNAEMIDYLLEYCASKGTKSFHYIEKTAQAWVEQGIKTPKQARESTNTYHKYCFSVLKAFGIRNRHPSPTEEEMITAWVNTLGFDLPIIIEACNRTIQKTHNPSFEYANKILTDWKKKEVHTLADIEKLDKNFQEKKQQEKTKKTTNSPTINSKFHNFTQRSFSNDELEEEWLD